MSTKSPESRFPEGVPEELCRLAKNVLKEGNFRVETGNGTESSEVLLDYAEFLFNIAKTRLEFQQAIDIVQRWIEVKLVEGKYSENTKLTISKKLEFLAIESLIRFLPTECSIIEDFPIKLFNIEERRKINVVKVRAPARIDFAGGWTDTPPITYDLGTPRIQSTLEPSGTPEVVIAPRVLNAAVLIDGKRPIAAEVHRLFYNPGIWIQTEGVLRCFKSKKEIVGNAKKPSEIGSLICAVIVTSGVFESWGKPMDFEMSEISEKLDFGDDEACGLLIKSHSDLPHGSGLGTSSILSGVILAGIWTLFGKKFEDKDLIKAVSKVEQFHTTRGGWQDQVGGLLPGIKLASVDSDFHRSVTWEKINISESFEKELNSRIFLIYTGKTRLAKDLLETVILNWINRDKEIHKAFKTLALQAEIAGGKISSGIFPTEEVSDYHELKKKVAFGAEPIFIKNLISELKSENLIETAWISGAGGGGFLYVYLQKNKNFDDLKKFISKEKYSDLNLEISSIQIDNEALKIEIME
ncbi:hypothetical protein FO519_008415 [Halicephalobus sp. NKZ332]|nr:hypothetical protein FO519_008415 [Halicephalobus sp. NKZ332]